MYTIHHTEGVVLGSRDSGESSRYLYLFTKDLGLVGAHARGLRELKSKLRYGLQDYSHAHVDLLQAKNGWRVKSSIPIVNYASLLSEVGGGIRFAVITRITALLRRLLHGETEHKNLYHDFMRGLEVFREKSLACEEAESLEIILVMRILHHLGYWGEQQTLSLFLAEDLANPALLSIAQKEKRLAIREINKALKETQL